MDKEIDLYCIDLTVNLWKNIENCLDALKRIEPNQTKPNQIRTRIKKMKIRSKINTFVCCDLAASFKQNQNPDTVLDGITNYRIKSRRFSGGSHRLLYHNNSVSSFTSKWLNSKFPNFYLKLLFL